MEMIGWIGSLFLAFCGIPQAWQSFRQKNSAGISREFLAMWFVGEIFTILYVFPKMDLPLLFNYSVNLVCLIIIGFYKIRGRE